MKIVSIQDQSMKYQLWALPHYARYTINKHNQRNQLQFACSNNCDVRQSRYTLSLFVAWSLRGVQTASDGSYINTTHEQTTVHIMLVSTHRYYEHCVYQIRVQLHEPELCSLQLSLTKLVTTQPSLLAVQSCVIYLVEYQSLYDHSRVGPRGFLMADFF